MPGPMEEMTWFVKFGSYRPAPLRVSSGSSGLFVLMVADMIVMRSCYVRARYELAPTVVDYAYKFALRSGFGVSLCYSKCLGTLMRGSRDPYIKLCETTSAVFKLGKLNVPSSDSVV